MCTVAFHGVLDEAPHSFGTGDTGVVSGQQRVNRVGEIIFGALFAVTSEIVKPIVDGAAVFKFALIVEHEDFRSHFRGNFSDTPEIAIVFQGKLYGVFVREPVHVAPFQGSEYQAKDVNRLTRVFIPDGVQYRDVLLADGTVYSQEYEHRDATGFSGSATILTLSISGAEPEQKNDGNTKGFHVIKLILPGYLSRRCRRNDPGEEGRYIFTCSVRKKLLPSEGRMPGPG